MARPRPSPRGAAPAAPCPSLSAPGGASAGGTSRRRCSIRTRRPARIDNYSEATGPAADLTRSRVVRSIVGAPISVEGRLWGFISVMTSRAERLPADTEGRLAGFTELVATAIVNAEAQDALTASRARIVAAADTTRRRIERDLHDGARRSSTSWCVRLGSARRIASAQSRNPVDAVVARRPC
jgi:GAF domain-containing protein